ncbi:YlbF family regulator [Paenibacillus beijingensis]|uniref:UPF0342 protein VN24_17255 n=1 Tax=Paenibacillus beijingensis TaxID=1126833 RepID=A0A0D5NLF3_9BACL|nr:YlbF family regulator [Paenibacillus beijingensis]AJY75980.1 hypothetical protein VN24_17255 [Paenibacillus beijingensis]
MNVYDKTYELAKALKESPEAHDLKEARRQAEADADAKRMLDDFRERQNGFQQKMMSGEEPTPEEIDNLNKLYEVLSLNPVISHYFEAERRFAVVFEDVNRIISDSLKTVLE